MDDELTRTGEEAIAKLGPRASEISQMVTASFGPKSLADVQASFEAAIASGAPGAINAEVEKVGALVREQAATALMDFKAVEMWLAIKTPEVADGNNFGVEVQAFVAGVLKEMRTELTAMVDGVSAYHLLRGGTLEKVVKVPSHTKDEETKQEVEGDKTTNKTTKTSKCSATEQVALPDYLKYIAALDTKEYHAYYMKLVDVRHCPRPSPCPQPSPCSAESKQATARRRGAAGPALRAPPLSRWPPSRPAALVHRGASSP